MFAKDLHHQIFDNQTYRGVRPLRIKLRSKCGNEALNAVQRIPLPPLHVLFRDAALKLSDLCSQVRNFLTQTRQLVSLIIQFNCMKKASDKSINLVISISRSAGFAGNPFQERNLASNLVKL